MCNEEHRLEELNESTPLPRKFYYGDSFVQNDVPWDARQQIPNLREYYESIVKRHELEEGQIAERVKWFLTIQGFLLTGFAILARLGSRNDDYIELTFLLMFLLPILGLLVSIWAFIGIRTARFAQKMAEEDWELRLKKYFSDYKDVNMTPKKYVQFFPPIDGCPRKLNPLWAFLPSRILPPTFGITWGIILTTLTKLSSDEDHMTPAVFGGIIALILLLYYLNFEGMNERKRNPQNYHI